MTARRPCPPAPGWLETYAAQFDYLFHSLAQRRHFRTYLAGLLAPRDRPKTLTALAGAEPFIEAQAAVVQRLQFFLSEAAWESAAVAERTLQLLLVNPLTAPTDDGVLVIDDTGDRKEGNATDHVARQYLGSVGKVDNGIVAVTALWANGKRYYPLQVAPYAPAARLPDGKQDASFRTKPQLALALINQAQSSGIAFKAIVADCWYGDHDALQAALTRHRLPFVLAHRGKMGRGWAPAEGAHSLEDAARTLPLRAWRRVTRRFRDGHVEHWWAVELTWLGYGPNQPVRAICATIDRRSLPARLTWYLTTNLPVDQASLAEVVRLYGLRHWIEQSYKQMKNELGWADFMVRSDRAIRRHWTLVCCAFAFCWWHEAMQLGTAKSVAPVKQTSGMRKKNTDSTCADTALLATPAAGSACLACSDWLADAMLARLRQQAPATRLHRLA
jgi:SRSO17 transposase